MAIIQKPVIKRKVHSKKSKVRVSNKKAVKNGRQQPKPKAKTVKAVSGSEKEVGFDSHDPFDDIDIYDDLGMDDVDIDEVDGEDGNLNQHG